LFAVIDIDRSSARVRGRRLGRASESATTARAAADTTGTNSAESAVIAARSRCATEQRDVQCLAATHRG